MQRLPLAKYTACKIIIWGCVLSCMAACHNWAGLMVVRTFLGVFEASITLGLLCSHPNGIVNTNKGVEPDSGFRSTVLRKLSVELLRMGLPGVLTQAKPPLLDGGLCSFGPDLSLQHLAPSCSSLCLIILSKQSFLLQKSGFWQLKELE